MVKAEVIGAPQKEVIEKLKLNQIK